MWLGRPRHRARHLVSVSARFSLRAGTLPNNPLFPFTLLFKAKMSNDALIPVIHFEKQVGALCAQHAINALLQNEYYSAVDLASIAQSLDEKEHAALIESGATDQDIAVFTKDGSSNYDDSGFFSSQVGWISYTSTSTSRPFNNLDSIYHSFRSLKRHSIPGILA